MVEMYTSIPNAYLWIVPNGGHFPFHEAQAKHFTQMVTEFVQGKWQ
jgi:pimeloyl-ACP methyl ester carboxylesterase